MHSVIQNRDTLLVHRDWTRPGHWFQSVKTTNSHSVSCKTLILALHKPWHQRRVHWDSGISNGISRSARSGWYGKTRTLVTCTHRCSQFIVTNVFTIFIPLWGMIGIWTNRIGYAKFFWNILGLMFLKLPQCLGVLVRRIRISNTSTNHSIQGHIMSFSEFSKHLTMLSHKPWWPN